MGFYHLGRDGRSGVAVVSKTSYSDAEIEQGISLRQQGLTWKEIAKELGGTEQSWRMLVSRREDKLGGENPPPYQHGRTARVKGYSKEHCPHPAMTCVGSWWLAGWNDCDRGLI